MGALIRRLLSMENKLTSWLSFVAPTVTRIVVGWSMYLDGKGKLEHLDAVIANLFSKLYIPFTDIPLPHPELQALAVSKLEYYGGLLLLFGFLTRPISLALAGAMVGAVLMTDSQEMLTKWANATPTDATSFILFVLLLWPAFYGAGPLSMDGIIGFVVRRWRDQVKIDLRTEAREIVACWLLRVLVVLLLMAMVPVADGDPTLIVLGGYSHLFPPAGTLMVDVGVKERHVRPPHPGEFDENPPEVVQFIPNVKMLVLYAVLWIALGMMVVFLCRPKAASRPPKTPPPSDSSSP